MYLVFKKGVKRECISMQYRTAPNSSCWSILMKLCYCSSGLFVGAERSLREDGGTWEGEYAGPHPTGGGDLLRLLLRPLLDRLRPVCVGGLGLPLLVAQAKGGVCRQQRCSWRWTHAAGSTIVRVLHAHWFLWVGVPSAHWAIGSVYIVRSGIPFGVWAWTCCIGRWLVLGDLASRALIWRQITSALADCY